MSESMDISLYFDESGKNNKGINLMGSLMIPNNILQASNISSIEKDLVDELLYFHWSKMKNTQMKNIKKLFLEIFKFIDLIDFNAILFDEITIDKYNLKPEKKDIINTMIYEKFPERILYGLLRNLYSYKEINVDIFIEHSTEYIKMDLSTKLLNSLNTHAVYRGENYNIKSCELIPKNTKIGLECTDLLIGIVRFILENDISSNNKKMKNKLIIDLLKDTDIFNFFNNICIYKWSYNQKLIKIPFSPILKIFLNQEKWIKTKIIS